jgi:hypothetical protein
VSDSTVTWLVSAKDGLSDAVSEGSTTRLFADDCALYRDIKTTEDARKLQDDLEQLQKWDHFRLLCMLSPKYFAESTTSRVWPWMLYLWLMMFLLLVPALY